MPITTNSSRPTPPKRQRANIWSWLIFLLILARPLYGVLRSVIPAQVSAIQIVAVAAGVIVLGLMFSLVLNTARQRASDTWRPTPSPQSTWDRPVMTASRSSNASPPLLRSNSPTPRIPAGGPRFEPVVTGKVIVAGIITAGVIAAAIAFLWTLLTVAAIR
jgi:hypothetical protein